MSFERIRKNVLKVTLRLNAKPLTLNPKQKNLNPKQNTLNPWHAVEPTYERLHAYTSFKSPLNQWPRNQDRLRTLNPLAGSALAGWLAALPVFHQGRYHGGKHSAYHGASHGAELYVKHGANHSAQHGGQLF